MSDHDHLSLRLINTRKRLGLSEEQIASYIGISKNELIQRESGELHIDNKYTRSLRKKLTELEYIAALSPQFTLVSFGVRVRLMRKICGLTQMQLAEATSMSRGWLISIEDGQSNVTIELLVKLADTLNTSIDFLIRGKA